MYYVIDKKDKYFSLAKFESSKSSIEITRPNHPQG